MNSFYAQTNKRIKASFILSLMAHIAVISAVILIISLRHNNIKRNRLVFVTLANPAAVSLGYRKYYADSGPKTPLQATTDKKKLLTGYGGQKTNFSPFFQKNHYINENKTSRTNAPVNFGAPVRSPHNGIRSNASGIKTGKRAGKNTAGNSDGNYADKHLAFITELIKKNLRYPFVARKMGWTGTVTVTFEITQNGSARGFKVVRTSGHSILDENAVNAIKKINSFPKPHDRISLTIPITYRLN